MSLFVTFLLKFQVIYKISDNAIVFLLRFFKYLLISICTLFSLQTLREINIPQSIYGCRSIAGIPHNSFEIFPVCPACHMLFESDVKKLIVGTLSNRASIKCNFVRFPQHPQERFRRPCGTDLLTRVKRSGNRIDLKSVLLLRNKGSLMQSFKKSQFS